MRLEAAPSERRHGHRPVRRNDGRLLVDLLKRRSFHIAFLYCLFHNVVRKAFHDITERLKLNGRQICDAEEVSRTIADLDQSEKIRVEHIEEALIYRF